MWDPDWKLEILSPLLAPHKCRQDPQEWPQMVLSGSRHICSGHGGRSLGVWGVLYRKLPAAVFSDLGGGGGVLHRAGAPVRSALQPINSEARMWRALKPAVGRMLMSQPQPMGRADVTCFPPAAYKGLAVWPLSALLSALGGVLERKELGSLIPFRGEWSIFFLFPIVFLTILFS